MNAKTLLFVGIIVALAVTVPAFGDEDFDWMETEWVLRSDVKPVDNLRYERECGSCHMAYQPGLLPARSWGRMMSSLTDHFGEDADLADDVRGELLAYLQQNSADTSEYKRSRYIMSSLRPTDTPLRISETPYIWKTHQEILGAKTRIKSASHCQECHAGAEKGSYNERDNALPDMDQ